MRPIDLARYCAEEMAKQGEGATIILTLRRGEKPRIFPRGELLCETIQNGIRLKVKRYKAAAVLRTLVRECLIKVSKKEGGLLIEEC